LCVSDPFFDAQTLRRKEDDEEEEQMRAIFLWKQKYHNTHSPPHKNAGSEGEREKTRIRTTTTIIMVATENTTNTTDVVASTSVVGMKRPAPSLATDNHLQQHHQEGDCASVKKQHLTNGDNKEDDDFKNTQSIIRRLVENSIANILAQNDEGNGQQTMIGVAPHVKEGSRIEIRWVIQNTLSDEENVPATNKQIKEEIVWWGATVTKRGEGNNTSTNSNSDVCEVIYDARTEEFPAEAGKVVLLSEHECRDGDDPSIKFYWRKEGDSTFVVDGDGEDDDLEEEMTMQDVLEYQTKIDGDAGDGDTLADASEKAFGTLPMDQQLRLATGFAQMKGKLMQKLREISEKNGAGYTVTKDDMERIMMELRNES